MADPTCTVVFANGACCTRRRRGAQPWCKPCAEWSRKHGRRDPNGRTPNRCTGELQAELHAVASAATDDCVILKNRNGTRPKVEIDGRVIWAARAVWITAQGDPGDAFVLHTCHRGDDGCINIRHLYLGDHAQNVSDMVQAGRQSRGEGQPSAVLSEDTVRAIRQEYVPRMVTQQFLADKYGISRSNVSNILRGAQWKHVA
ncbi:hypothetical protein [Streptomyces sp. NPDC056291]|uniref:hypothetical protein n=1 Tax=Streptomyces sp. NPDC056291 TaxID=3345772 RepID=UPI0035D9CDD4